METQMVYIQNGKNVLRNDGIMKNDDENIKNFVIRMSTKGIIDIVKLRNELNDYIAQKIVNGIDKTCENIIKRS